MDIDLYDKRAAHYLTLYCGVNIKQIGKRVRLNLLPITNKTGHSNMFVAPSQ